MQEEVSEVENITRYIGTSHLVTYGEKELRLVTTFVDPDFLAMFNFPVLQGEKDPLSNMSSVAITENAANKIFGPQDERGKNLNV